MIDETSAIYQIYLRNFTPEGTFGAAIPRLAGIAAMGFDWIYLTPIHPSGRAGRKGSLGSPYAIADYRAVDPDLGAIDDFRAFLKAAHGAGLKVMMDVVYNHTSPDSVLARENPEWFLRGSGGSLGRKCADWSDVVDFDYGSSPQLWVELMSILVGWREEGVDGFRCDVASLVPVDFWKQARQRVNQYDPGTCKELHPILWLAESVHPHFLKQMREAGWGAWSEPELHAVFDLTYDYDGWERLEKVWKNEGGAREYLEYLFVQETLYPAKARKIRFLENHDQARAAERFGARAGLESWTLFYQFIPGVAFAYMGQELAIAHKPDLFEKDPVDWSSGDAAFRGFFVRALAACTRMKAAAPRFSWTEVGRGVFLLERSAAATMAAPAGTAALSSAGSLVRFALLVDLEGRGGKIKLPAPLRGRDVMGGGEVALESEIAVPKRPLFVEIFA